MSPTSERIDAFWKLFLTLHGQLAVAASAADPVYDRLLAALQDVDPRLFLEFSTTETPCELVITAEGERAAFGIARAVAGSAPSVDGWTVQALKPRLGFPATVTWEGFSIELSKVLFIPVPQDAGRAIGLRLLVPNLSHAHLEDALNGILRALDHGLGEERHAAVIRFVDVAPLPETSVPARAIPLVELEEYIDRYVSDGDEAG